ncbi:hypothetical protein GGR51DRAFT_520236 [Nemania sp. FL0031]|nr:hypothetical protein GGR51DRAFT_520236 [Nemania sp. FL0031]
MRFSNHGAVAMAMAASLVAAHDSPLEYSHSGKDLLDLDLGKTLHTGLDLDLHKGIHAGVDLNADLSGKVLVAGLLADIIVDPIAEVKAGAKVEVKCEDCHIKGDIDASISLAKVVPALSLSLKDVEVLLDLDVYIGAAATIAVNLVTPAKVSLPLPGLNVEALVHLDLILGVHTELDLSAGVYVSLPEASLETDILSGDILDVDFSGVVVKVLPIKVRIGCTELLADLRLRVDLGVSAAVDVDDILPLDQLIPGLDLGIDAGLELAVFVNLLEYVGLFCDAPGCPLVKESYGLNIGAAVELDVEVEDLLSIHLAPSVVTTILQIPPKDICIPSYPSTSTPGYSSGFPTPSGPSSTGVPTPSGPGSSSGIPTGPSSSLPGFPTGIPTSSIPSFPTLPSSSIPGFPSSSAPGSPSGSPSSSLPDFPTGVPTSSVPGSPSGPGSSGLPSPSGSGSSGVPTSGASVPTGSASGSVSTPSGPAPTSAPGGGEGSVTSTITSTATYTVTACAVNVPNCPAGYQTSVTLTHTTSFTTVCPASGSETGAVTAPPAPTSTGHNIQTITKEVTTMVPCSSTSTFVPPASISSPPYPGDIPHSTASYTAAVTPSSPAGYTGSVPVGYPSPSSFPGASATYPAGGPSASYPAGGPSASYPAASSSVIVGYPTPVPYPSGPAPPSGGNGTVPQTWATYAPSSTPSGPVGYPTATPPVTAGASKFGSKVAAVFALMGAVVVM